VPIARSVRELTPTFGLFTGVVVRLFMAIILSWSIDFFVAVFRDPSSCTPPQLGTFFFFAVPPLSPLHGGLSLTGPFGSDPYLASLSSFLILMGSPMFHASSLFLSFFYAYFYGGTFLRRLSFSSSPRWTSYPPPPATFSARSFLPLNLIPRVLIALIQIRDCQSFAPLLLNCLSG